MSYSVALCIPVYEKTDVVEEFLLKWSEYYIQAGIDIYFYDSSISDGIQNIIAGWHDHEHIFYVRCPSDIDGSRKAYRIFRGEDRKREYDFLWLSNDTIRCSREGLEIIMKWVRPEYDMIIINHNDIENTGVREYTDPDACLLNCAWVTGLWGAVILNSHTMLSNVNWSFYKEIFWNKEVSNWTHVAFYFFRAAEMKNFHAVHLTSSIQGITLMRSSELKKTSAWTKDEAFWTVSSQIQTLFSQLPRIYTNRWAACRKFCDLATLPNANALLRFRRLGIYNRKVYYRYRNIWDKLSSIPRWKFFLIALLPGKVAEWGFQIRIKRDLRKIRRLSERYPILMIYGAGIHGNACGMYFEKAGIAYDSFCVTNRRKGKDTYRGRPVFEFRELTKRLDKIGFVVALSKANTKSVLPVLNEKLRRDQLFVDPVFTAYAGEQVGYNLTANIF